MARDDWPITTLREALEGRNVPELKILAEGFSTEIPPRKAELVSFILGQMHGDGMRRAWERLDELQRHAVSEAVHSPGSRLDPSAFSAKYGGPPPRAGTAISARGRSFPILGLFFFGAWVIPDDLKARLRTWVPSPPACRLATVTAPPQTFAYPSIRYVGNGVSYNSEEEIPVAVRQCSAAAEHEVHAVLRLVDEGRLSVSDRTRRPGASATRALEPLLVGGDFYPVTEGPGDDEGQAEGPIRAFAWPLLIQAGGLANLRGSKLALTRAGREALRAPPAPTLRSIWERWSESTLLDELFRVDAIKGQAGSQGKRSLTAVGPRRMAIGEGLAECPVGEWVAVDEFFRFLRGAGYDFEVARNAWPLYIADSQYGSLGYDGCGGWNILQARYALCVLFEYVATLGMIDVAYVAPAGARPDFQQLWGTDDLDFLSRYDGLLCLRLTDLGAYCLGVRDDYVPPVPASVLRVLGNLDIVAPDGLSPAEASALDRYARRTSDLVWRLDRGRLLGLVEQGTGIGQVRDFLATRCDGQLPDVVTQLLADTQTRAGRIRDGGPARLIECEDPTLAVLLLNDASTAPFCLPAGERHVVVPAGSEGAFRRGLRKLGYAVSPADHDGALSPLDGGDPGKQGVGAHPEEPEAHAVGAPRR
jgi:hypothetical protein